MTFKNINLAGLSGLVGVVGQLALAAEQIFTVPQSGQQKTAFVVALGSKFLADAAPLQMGINPVSIGGVIMNMVPDVVAAIKAAKGFSSPVVIAQNAALAPVELAAPAPVPVAVAIPAPAPAPAPLASSPAELGDPTGPIMINGIAMVPAPAPAPDFTAAEHAGTAAAPGQVGGPLGQRQ